MLEILALTDIHYNLGNLRRIIGLATTADLILIAGDVTNFGRAIEAREVFNIVKSAGKPFFFVPGNCDYYGDFSQDVLEYSIHGKGVIFRDLAIIGLGGSTPTPFNTPLEFSEEQIEHILNEALKSITKEYKSLILVSHVPPYDTLVDLTKTKAHVGSKSVRKFIETNNPTLVISGHVHEAVNVDKLGKTILVNPGPVNLGRYARIFFKEDIEVKLERL